MPQNNELHDEIRKTIKEAEDCVYWSGRLSERSEVLLKTVQDLMFAIWLRQEDVTADDLLKEN